MTLTQTLVSKDPESGLFTTTETITTTFSPTSIAPADPARTSEVVGRATETAIPKIPSVKTQPKSGLSKGAMNGIIAGAVVILVVILITAFFILRKLKKVSRHPEHYSGHEVNINKLDVSGGSGGSNGGRSGNEMVAQSTVSFDPLMIRSEQTTPRLQRPSMTHPASSDTDPYGYTYSGNSTPPIPAPYVHGQSYPSGYVSVPVNDAGYFDQNTGQPYQVQHDASGAVAYTPPYNNRISEISSTRYSTVTGTDQNLRFGHDSYNSSQGHPSRPSIASIGSHGRQRSDTSDYSQGSADSNPPLNELDGRRISLPESELDSTTTAWGKRASGIAASSSMREGATHNRKSKSGWNFMHNRKRSLPGVQAQPLSGGGRLEGVAETEHDGGILGLPAEAPGKGKSKTKAADWTRPKILTKDSTDRDQSPAKKGRSRSDSVVPTVAMYSYANQEESNRLPGGSPATPIARRGSAQNFPAQPVNMPSRTEGAPQGSILAITSVETRVGEAELGRSSGEVKKEGVMVSTYEVMDDRDRIR